MILEGDDLVVPEEWRSRVSIWTRVDLGPCQELVFDLSDLRYGDRDREFEGVTTLFGYGVAFVDRDGVTWKRDEAGHLSRMADGATPVEAWSKEERSDRNGKYVEGRAEGDPEVKPAPYCGDARAAK
ncbi:hypothetical protein ACH5AL_15135 [Actinacidiphila glaucinigra]|uniref:hypothetical protein n=1 Tax=Actinacidiphila glaucinigra TaxID=235986 RepID=UPI0037B6245D